MHCSVVQWHNCLKKKIIEKLFTLSVSDREEKDREAPKGGNFCTLKSLFRQQEIKKHFKAPKRFMALSSSYLNQ
jgi:hypothetical protein